MCQYDPVPTWIYLYLPIPNPVHKFATAGCQAASCTLQ